MDVHKLLVQIYSIFAACEIPTHGIYLLTRSSKPHTKLGDVTHSNIMAYENPLPCHDTNIMVRI